MLVFYVCRRVRARWERGRRPPERKQEAVSVSRSDSAPHDLMDTHTPC